MDIPAHSLKQAQRLVEFQVDHVVDTHCHILPGVDDGPATMDDALALARLLVEDGVTDVIATPHQLGRWDGTNRGPAIRIAVQALQVKLRESSIPLSVHPGGEVRIDERLRQLLDNDDVLTLADRRSHLLLELPNNLIIDPALVFPIAQSINAQLVLAHIERYELSMRDPKAVQQWAAGGIALQINAAALLGGTTKQEELAWSWLEAGWIALVATDAHSTGMRRPQLTAAMTRIAGRLGLEVARRVCIDNPNLILAGKRIATVA